MGGERRLALTFSQHIPVKAATLSDTVLSSPKASEPRVPPAPPGVARKVRVSHFGQMKDARRPIVMITAYDATMAALADAASADMILVGDSLGQVVHGFETTLPVTMDMMVMHTAAVARGARRAFIVADMPFMSYQVAPKETLENAGRLMKEGNAEAVKLETGNERIVDTVRYIAEAGIPVMGHIGLTPQAIHQLGGYKVQGRHEPDADRLIEIALRVQEAGAFAIVLELMPRDLARRITERLEIPTIGIGAGADCDGQVLVMNDLLGLTEKPPRFAKKYVDMRAGALRGIRKYSRDVRERHFPAPEHEFE